MSKQIAFWIIFLWLTGAYAQNDTLRALFLGNSYTNYNNLPNLVQSFSSAANKTLIVDSNTPGGYSLDLHSTNAVSLSKIASGNWDVVILQEQSQIPTIDFYKYGSMYPACRRLNDSIKKYNPCARIILYMTWGRRFGGQQCDNGNINCSPIFTDFNHMQDSLETAYLSIADTINAVVAPVGISWKNILSDTNLVLHTSDNSHPSYLGSFTAATTFYQIIWNQSPDSSIFQGTLSSSTSSYVKRKVDSTISNATNKWRINLPLPTINFSSIIQGDSVLFTNLSPKSVKFDWLWLFGDGDSLVGLNALHRFQSSGTYTVKLIRKHCEGSDTLKQTIIINPTSLIEQKEEILKVYPNPFYDELNLELNNGVGKKVSIYNVKGEIQRIITLKGSGANTIDVRDLSQGIYFLVINDGEEKRQQIKLLKH